MHCHCVLISAHLSLGIFHFAHLFSLVPTCSLSLSLHFPLPTLSVSLSLCQQQKRDFRAHTPKFPKTKNEGWWVLIGEVDSGELVALKRLSYLQKKITLAFTPPEEPCRKIYSLYLISDCYLGLDQQHEMYLNFVVK